MKAPGVVVADTTPLNYLILTDPAETLASLFGEVMMHAVSHNLVRSLMQEAAIRHQVDLITPALADPSCSKADLTPPRPGTRPIIRR